MAYTRPKHYIWQAFCEMCQREPITAVEAIHRLQSAFPYEQVEAIVRAEGDMSRTLEQIASAPLPNLSSQGQQSQSSTNQQGNQGDQQGQRGEPTFNDLIRQRAGVGSTTVTLPRSAITGVKNQPEYDPEADPFRSRYRERYSQD